MLQSVLKAWPGLGYGEVGVAAKHRSRVSSLLQEACETLDGYWFEVPSREFYEQPAVSSIS